MVSLNTLKHRLLGHQRVWAYGIGNQILDGSEKFYFFYDYEGAKIKEFHRACKGLEGYNVEVWLTKRGEQLRMWETFSLRDLYQEFLTWQRAFPNDYKWTLPLILRTSAKWDMKGNVASPAPQPLWHGDAYKPPDRVQRLLYSGWDK